jgi:hypothetical protein
MARPITLLTLEGDSAGTVYINTPADPSVIIYNEAAYLPVRDNWLARLAHWLAGNPNPPVYREILSISLTEDGERYIPAKNESDDLIPSGLIGANNPNSGIGCELPPDDMRCCSECHGMGHFGNGVSLTCFRCQGSGLEPPDFS